MNTQVIVRDCVGHTHYTEIEIVPRQGESIILELTDQNIEYECVVDQVVYRQKNNRFYVYASVKQLYTGIL